MPEEARKWLEEATKDIEYLPEPPSITHIRRLLAEVKEKTEWWQEYVGHYGDLEEENERLWEAFIEKMVKSGARLFLDDGEFVSRNWKLVFDKTTYDDLFGHGSYEPDEIAWLMENSVLQAIEGGDDERKGE